MQLGAVTETIGAAQGATGNTAQATPQPRLVKAAHEFEAQMMSELMKPMLSDTSITGDDDADSDSGAGSGAGGGFGIANRIIKQLSPSGNQNGKAPVTGMLHGNTVIKTLK
jgi:Rod binding domain-containing protein